jgi:hypothetical protein
LQVSCHDATSSGLAPDKVRPFGGTPRSARRCRERKVFREVSAYSDFLDHAWAVESSDARFQKVSGSKMATGQIPQRLRRSFDLPALVAIARAKCHPLNWSFSRVRLPRLHRCTRSLVQLARSSLVASFTLAVPCPFSLVVICEANLAREIWTQFSITRIATGLGPTIAWKASPTRTPPPICTSAPCLEPRWSKIVGAASN